MSLCANSAFSVFGEHPADVPVWEKQSGVQVFLIIYGPPWTGLSKSLRNEVLDGESGGGSKGRNLPALLSLQKEALGPWCLAQS